jgi:hypothetical protein
MRLPVPAAQSPQQRCGGRTSRPPLLRPAPRPPRATSPPLPQAKTHEKVDSIGEERSIGCHAVVMLIRKD